MYKGSEPMKKLKTMTIGILLIGMFLATATLSFAVQDLKIGASSSATGSFEGSMGPRPHGNQTVGTISGTYKLRNHGGRFNGDWNITLQNNSVSGTMKGVFARHFIFGKIIVAGTGRTMQIVGFLRVNNETFAGRFMAPVGPALYFWGTYT
jgi:hypothetical protein